MDTNNIYIIYYNKTGNFYGFYDDNEIAEGIITENSDLTYKQITPEVHKYILSHMYNPGKPIIDLNKVANIETINSTNCIIEQTPKIRSLESIKKSLISNIKAQCGKFITNGLFIGLSTDEVKEFSFKIEDQINLKELVDNHSENDMVYYHANGEFDTEYSYTDILTIYKTLYNNKIYNQIYSQILCKWITDEFTQEMYDSKEYIIDYGYSNDYILEEVTSKYESNKLL